ncbi:hypothetical protein TNCV_939011 [Trichonephila clavipes]|nr:hypothetical protein TNCV_939011 [Trichonephila clavipes]
MQIVFDGWRAQNILSHAIIGTRAIGSPSLTKTNEQKWIPNHSLRCRHSKEDHFKPGKAEKITTAPTLKSSKNTRRRSSQQQNCRERKGGANRNRSISLEVLVGDVNCKS